MKDFLVRKPLKDLDPDILNLINIETERQYRKLILIPSESTAPAAVRESMGSVFQNLYAEGYPDEETRSMSNDELLDYEMQLAHYRRYSDPRYYKGVEYADILEPLTRLRAAETFATEEVPASDLFVNVQALSGAPANNAVYTALVQPGDTVLSMDLLHGGHLSHGSPVNRSGKLFNIVHYTIDPETEKINYDAVQKLAEENQPKIIIAGYSSYPWVPDWKRFREIADSVGAYLLADVSHIAGLIAAKTIPSPVNYADIITFTTHKTLCGPRAAIILCKSRVISRKIDRGVFPGEQGGPHVHIFAALSTMFKIAQTPEFKELQEQILKNCQVMTNRLKERGFKIPFSGTDTHLGNIDCKSIKGPDGAELTGDLAARILDIAGIVTNRNTIPGDKSAFRASGVRFGTPWITQRGFKEKETEQLADIIADVLESITPYYITARRGNAVRAKIDFKALEEAKIKIRDLAETAGFDNEIPDFGYPHFYYLDNEPNSKSGWTAYDMRGPKVRIFVNYIFSSDVEGLTVGESQKSQINVENESIDVVLTCLEEEKYRVSVPSGKANLVATWLRDLSDGFIKFDDDLLKKLPGPIVVSETNASPYSDVGGEIISSTKPYYIGQKSAAGKELPKFTWEEKESDSLRRTPLYEVHKKSGAKIIPFAGWEMPVWYTSVLEEHNATRSAAGLFDVAHMGVYQAEGPDAPVFLDSVCANDIGALEIGESCYTHFLDTDANVIDDLLVYRRSKENYLVVVNASNDDKDWAWLNAVKDGKVLVDQNNPSAVAFGRNVTLRNLRDPKEGKDMRVDIALQGKKSRDILLALGCDDATRKNIMKLKRTQLCEAVVGGIDLVVSRTGYTGEGMAFELFVHPDNAVSLWEKLMEAGEPMGLKPCGLGARDSLRTEFGLPLYGHEMGGEKNLGVADAGFGAYVKTHKPWFIGRESFLAKEANRDSVVVRFTFEEKRTKMAHLGDPVLDDKGKVIGYVTSCAIDKDGSLTGQAYISMKYAVEDTRIFIYQSASNKASKTPAELESGDRVTLPTAALVVSRFAKLK